MNINQIQRFHQLYKEINDHLLRYVEQSKTEDAKESYQEMLEYDEIVDVTMLEEDLLERENGYMSDLMPMFKETANDIQYQYMCRVFGELKADLWSDCKKAVPTSVSVPKGVGSNG